MVYFLYYLVALLICCVSVLYLFVFCVVFFFFFKQKTAYEMLRSLVGSEMCIRDSNYAGGTECPLVISWPKGIKARGEVRNQYHHAVDLSLIHI